MENPYSAAVQGATTCGEQATQQQLKGTNSERFAHPGWPMLLATARCVLPDIASDEGRQGNGLN